MILSELVLRVVLIVARRTLWLLGAGVPLMIDWSCCGVVYPYIEIIGVHDGNCIVCILLISSCIFIENSVISTLHISLRNKISLFLMVNYFLRLLVGIFIKK